MTAPKWVRPDHPRHPTPPPATTAATGPHGHFARQAITDAEHAGDPLTAARILRECANRITAQSDLWTRQRPRSVCAERREAA